MGRKEEGDMTAIYNKGHSAKREEGVRHIVNVRQLRETNERKRV